MEKKVMIGNEEVRLVSSGATPILYKNAFKADFFEDFGEIMEIADTASKAKKGQEIKALLPMFKSGQIAKLYNFVWVYAKNADQSIKPLDEWIEEFDEFPLFDFLQEIMDLMMSSITTKKG